MGYKKSFNLVTIQLIIPLSTMTKAEYKATYGIDLNDIDFEKVSLLQKEGSKEKYYVDEVKITEDGVDIYAGGSILSIGETSVSVTENAYSVGDAKPIYFHGLEMAKTPSECICYAHILNNTNTLINSVAKLLAWFTSFEDQVYLPVNGNAKVSGTLYNVYAFFKSAGSTVINMVYGTASGYAVMTAVNLSEIFSVVSDGVNKIN